MNKNKELSIKAYQHLVDKWINSVGVRYYNELTNMAILTEEVGEVARIISREYGEQSYKDAAQKGDLADELADVLFVVCCIANQTGVDLESAIQRNMQKKTKRDKERHQGNSKLTD